jgi:GT2 family glycosyltransferase
MSPTYRNYQRDSYSPYVSGHFFFTRGDYVNQIGFVDQIVFTEEEIFMALRYFTAGYNLYIPKNNYVFHHYGRKNRNLIWEDFPEKFYAYADKSKNFVQNIILYNIINDNYGFFNKRTLKDFEVYSGINFKARDPGEKMLNGLEPNVDHLE